MCVIIASPTGKIASELLSNALSCNPHGWGFCATVRQDGKRTVVMHKGLGIDSFWNSWSRCRPVGPTVFHARIATSGRINKANCHPFEIPGGWLFHNGRLDHWEPDDESEINDTQVFAQEILYDLGPANRWLASVSILRLIDLAIGRSKLVIMTAKAGFKIIGEDRGFWHDDTWFSNASCFSRAEDRNETLFG